MACCVLCHLGKRLSVHNAAVHSLIMQRKCRYPGPCNSVGQTIAGVLTTPLATLAVPTAWHTHFCDCSPLMLFTYPHALPEEDKTPEMNGLPELAVTFSIRLTQRDAATVHMESVLWLAFPAGPMTIPLYDQYWLGLNARLMEHLASSSYPQGTGPQCAERGAAVENSCATPGLPGAYGEL
jgi:hypothetical protein